MLRVGLGSFAGLPVELLGVIALLVLAGAVLLLPALGGLPDALAMLGQGEFGLAFGSLLLAGFLTVIAFGLGCVLLAWRLYQGDQAARVLTLILSVALSLALLVASDRSGWDVVVILAAASSGGVLAASPAAREFFTERRPPQYREPVPVVAARTVVIVLAWGLGVYGLALIPAASLDGKYGIIGLGLLGLSGGVLWVNARLGAADPQARMALSGLLAGYVVLLLIAGQATIAALLPAAMAIAPLWLMWGPPEAQRYFAGGDPELT